MLSQLQRPTPEQSVIVPFAHQAALVQLLSAHSRLNADTITQSVALATPTWCVHTDSVMYQEKRYNQVTCRGGLMQPWTDACAAARKHCQDALQEASSVLP